MPGARQPTAAPPIAESIGLASAVGVGIIDTSDGDALDPGGNWVKGYELIGEICNTSGRYIGSVKSCSDEGDLLDNAPDRSRSGALPGRQHVFPGKETSVGGDPFVIGAGIECSGRGAVDLADWRARADRRLELCRWSDLADELWTGASAKLEGSDSRYLMSPDATLILSGDALDVVNGLAHMEAALATCTCGGQKVIHASKYLLDHFKHKAVVIQQGTRWYTPGGALVMFDDGYPGLGPDTADYDPDNPGDELRAEPGADQSWIYGTLPVTVKWGPVRHPGLDGDGGGLVGVMDTQTNDIVVVAEQWAMASWLCCHFAALIDTTL